MGRFARSSGPIAPKPSVRNVDQSTSTRNTCSAYIIEAMLRGMEPFGHFVCSEIAQRMVRNRHFTSTSSRCKYFASLDLQCCSCEVGGHKRSKRGILHTSWPWLLTMAAAAAPIPGMQAGPGCGIHRAPYPPLFVFSCPCLHPHPLVHEVLVVDLASLYHLLWVNPFLGLESKIPFSAPSTLALKRGK